VQSAAASSAAGWQNPCLGQQIRIWALRHIHPQTQIGSGIDSSLAAWFCFATRAT
jgi:hypothetical protein